VSDERHDEIAARLRAEAGAEAPERLVADVMLQVRAEPWPRRIRPRHRRPWRPLGAVALVACFLAALVVGLGHGASCGPEAAGGSTASGRAASSAAPNLGPAGQASGTSAEKRAVHRSSFHLQEAVPQATNRPLPARELSAWSASAFRREALPPRLRRALEALILEHRRGGH
jgi:negative regulator of sigma E activity